MTRGEMSIALRDRDEATWRELYSHLIRPAALTVLRDLRAGRVEVLTPAGAVRIPEHPVFWAGFALIGEPD